MTIPMLTELQAYEAMLLFLEAYWERGERSSDDIAIMLGEMQFTRGGTSDPAQWYDWKCAVAQVLQPEI